MFLAEKPQQEIAVVMGNTNGASLVMAVMLLWEENIPVPVLAGVMEPLGVELNLPMVARRTGCSSGKESRNARAGLDEPQLGETGSNETRRWGVNEQSQIRSGREM